MPLDRSLSPRALLVAALVIVLHAVALSVLDHAHRKRPIDVIVQNRPLVVTLMHAAPVPATPATPAAPLVQAAPPAPVAPPMRAEPPRPEHVTPRAVTPPPPVRPRPRTEPPKPHHARTPVEPAPRPAAPVAQPSAAPAPAPPAETAAAPAPADVPHPAARAPAPGAPGTGGAARLDCPAIEPAYPPMSARRGETGKVVIRLSINARGHVDDAQVKSSSGFPRLDESARDAALKLVCTPALSQGAPVAATGDRAYTFKLSQ